MFVHVYSNRDGETHMLRRMGPNELMNPYRFASDVADGYETTIANSNGYIPSGSGDITVEFRHTKNPTGSCWSSTDYFFERE